MTCSRISAIPVVIRRDPLAGGFLMTCSRISAIPVVIRRDPQSGILQTARLITEIKGDTV